MATECLYETSSPPSVVLMDAVFIFGSTIIKEVRAFCRQAGFEIDRVVIESFVAAEIKLNPIAHSSSSGFKLQIVEKGDEKIAKVEISCTTENKDVA